MRKFVADMEKHNEKDFLVGKTLTELQAICLEEGFPKFTATQVANWIYKNRVSSIEEMHNVSKRVRQFLSDNYEVGLQPPVDIQESKDGTKKYLFPVGKNQFIEAVMIPDGDRKTLCVSCQVGCKLGCKFCFTGQMGFIKDLSVNEIINQFLSIDESEELTNVVFMGMGEPFDNLDVVLNTCEILTAQYAFQMSPRRITVSTSGMIPEMERFIEESDCHLAVSLHSPFDEERLTLMPIQKKYKATDLVASLRKYDFGKQRRLSFEYIIFKGINDTPLHVRELVKLLHGLRCRVNVIRFHKTEGSPWESPDDMQVIRFVEQLNAKGLTATLRASRGEDIMAACGLLSTKEQEAK